MLSESTMGMDGGSDDFINLVTWLSLVVGVHVWLQVWVWVYICASLGCAIKTD